MEYYIGQIFEEMYPSEAAEWCNKNNAVLVELEPENDVRRFQIEEQPEPTPPTHDEISKMREAAYRENIDGLHARKQRKEILGEWTEEDETEYIAKVKQLSAEIAEQYPYPVEE